MHAYCLPKYYYHFFSAKQMYIPPEIMWLLINNWLVLLLLNVLSTLKKYMNRDSLCKYMQCMSVRYCRYFLLIYMDVIRIRL